MLDLIIIGAGPAGLSASVYASRYGIKHVVLGMPGGLANHAHEIGNWLGSQKISGAEFARNAEEHARSYGIEMIPVLADSIARKDSGFEICYGSEKRSARTVLIATGSSPRRLEVKGEQDYLGKGVSYCATCDGFLYKEKTVAVIGGSDAAAHSAMFLSGLAKEIYLIYRGGKLKCENFWISAIEKNPKIKILYETNITEIKGSGMVDSMTLDRQIDGRDSLAIDGIFIEIGHLPNDKIAKELGVELDGEGLIKVDQAGRTSQVGVWAAGDLTNGSNKFKQIITAAAEGAVATGDIKKYLASI